MIQAALVRAVDCLRQMLDREQQGERLSSSTGHYYHDVHIGLGAKAHVGDQYNIS
jgi:hypothetical protein